MNEERGGDPFRKFLEGIPRDWAPPAPESPRGRILDAARELATGAGLDGISTRAVADRAGVNQAMIHYYFGSKEKMIGALVRLEILGVLRDVIGGLEGISSGEDLLARFPVRLLDVLRSDMNRLRLLRRVLATDPERLTAAIREMGPHGILGSKGIVLERIEKDRAAGRLPEVEPRSILLFLLASVYGLVLLEPVARTVVGFQMDDDEHWRGYREDLRVLISQGLRSGAGREE